MRWPSFCGPAYQSFSVAAASDRCVNFINEYLPNKRRWVMFKRPGLKARFSFGSPQAVRALYEYNGRLFAVVADKFYELFEDYSYTELGTVVDDGRMATVDANGEQLFIVSGLHGYIYNLTTLVFVEIAGDFPGASMGGFVDNYFIALEPNSRKIYTSAIGDGTSWSALDYGVKESSPENITSFIIDHNDIYLFGKKTEVWYDSSDPDFAFQRRADAPIEQGVAAEFARSRVDNTVFFVGADERGQGIAWKLVGFTPVRISNHAIEYMWSTYSRMDDAVSWTYQEAGHTFWVVTFPTAQRTWSFDCAVGDSSGWIELSYWDAGSSLPIQHRGLCHAFAFGKHWVGDFENGKVYEQSAQYFDDDGAIIRAIRVPPYLENENEWLEVNRVECLIEAGVGLTGGSDPSIMIRASKDGGYTWGTERRMSLGKLGEYTHRAFLTRVIHGRKPTVEISISDPVKVAILDGFVEITGET